MQKKMVNYHSSALDIEMELRKLKNYKIYAKFGRKKTFSRGRGWKRAK